LRLVVHPKKQLKLRPCLVVLEPLMLKTTIDIFLLLKYIKCINKIETLSFTNKLLLKLGVYNGY